MKETVIKTKLDSLLENKNIGFYNKCEIVEIFGYDKEKKEAFNIYALIIFENTKQENTKTKFLTNKPQSFKGIKNKNWGIQRRIIDIETVKKLYSKILDTNEFCIDDTTLNVGKLNLLQEQYVPPRKDIQLNNLLKNNFHNGSYILEFFDEEKENINFLLDNPILLNSFSEQVSEILPLKLANVSDRLGNVIFQFPINSFDLSYESIIKENPPIYSGVSLEINPKNDNFDITNLQVRLFEENDNLITRQRLVDIQSNITEIEFDDCFGTHIEIIDKTSSLLLYKDKSFIMKQMNLNISAVEPQKRIFKLNDDLEEIKISSNVNNIYGKKTNKAFYEWIIDRKYEQELKELEKSKAFVQYFGDEEDKALADIRKLINKYGEKGVYLWDPYLSAKDIKNTLYFSKTTYVPLKAISGLKQYSKEKSKQNMIEEFKKDDKQFLFLNLEVRGKIGTGGYEFHDRFLIFPLEKPKVWSLGISVNQLGKSHHILQEVKNAQHILNAFNKLWGQLNNEECLVWKSN